MKQLDENDDPTLSTALMAALFWLIGLGQCTYHFAQPYKLELCYPTPKNQQYTRHTWFRL